MMTDNVFSSHSSKLLNFSNSRRSLSLLQGEEVFANRILSRDNSKGFSSRVYYLDVAGQVPFEWEAQPGQPKVVPEGAPLPPLSPPPAVLSSILDKERHSLPKPGSNRSKNRFWKKGRKAQQGQQGEKNSAYDVVERSDSFGLWSSEGDSFSSPRDSASSSSSFSSGCLSPVTKLPAGMKFPPTEFGMVVGHAANSKRRSGVQGLDWVLACTPWRLAGDGFVARNAFFSN